MRLTWQVSALDVHFEDDFLTAAAASIFSSKVSLLRLSSSLYLWNDHPWSRPFHHSLSLLRSPERAMHCLTTQPAHANGCSPVGLLVHKNGFPVGSFSCGEINEFTCLDVAMSSLS